MEDVQIINQFCQKIMEWLIALPHHDLGDLIFARLAIVAFPAAIFCQSFSLFE
ncbi:hypothetical protein D9M73_283000 [compost metagenome]